MGGGNAHRPTINLSELPASKTQLVIASDYDPNSRFELRGNPGFDGIIGLFGISDLP
jgi:hypothetical protein